MSTIQHHDGTEFVNGKGDRSNSFIFVDDPDGNSWAIHENPLLRAEATAPT